jgi:LmbE family N-acetylglucosaminyl deacetylase
MFDEKKVLVLSPHPDDAELGAGGTIVKMIERKSEVFWATFSWCKESLTEGMDIKKELSAALKSIDVNQKNQFGFDLPVRKFPQHRQEILEEMIKLRKDIAPDMVIVPGSSDSHQDHSTISTEAFRAFKHSTVLGFEEAWNDRTSTYALFSELTVSQLQKKIAAVRCYHSQQKRTYATAEYLTGLAIVRGQQINVRYAEALEVLRVVDKTR